MSHDITSHKVNGLNEALRVIALDEPGQGNANHKYEIRSEAHDMCALDTPCYIQFQDGPIGEFGVNGVSNEALIAIVEDRLKGFQSGPYVCRENALALTKLQEAMMWLHQRTRERIQRGVEGTNTI